MNLVDGIAKKVQRLPLEKQVEVHDFVDFLIERMLRDARRLQSFSDAGPAPPSVQTQTISSQRPVPPTAPPKTQSTPMVTANREQVLTSMVQAHQPPRFQSTSPVLMEKMLKTTQGQKTTSGVVATNEELPEVTVAEMEEAAGELEYFWSSWDEE